MSKIKIVLFAFVCTMLMIKNDVFALDSKLAKCVSENAKKQNTSVSKLEVLDCSSMQIKDIDGIESYSKLKVLNLSNNNITSMPSGIKKLNQLEELNISGNVIYYFPTEISSLSKLKALRVDSTHLLELNNIANLKQLEVLSLRNNQLFVLPKLNNSKLKELYIDNNFLSVTNVKVNQTMFKSGKQRTIDSLNKKMTFNKKSELFTFQDYLQRDIVDENKIALNGVKKYLIDDVVNKNNEKININEYINIDSGEVYKTGKFSGVISLKMNKEKVKTNILVSISTNKKKNQVEVNYSKRKTQTPQNNGERNNDITNKDSLKEKSKSSTPIFDTKEYSEKDNYKFLLSKNEYILLMLLLVLTIIPVLIILLIVWKIKKYGDDASTIGI